MKPSEARKRRLIRAAVAEAYEAVERALATRGLTSAQAGKIAEELVWKVATIQSDGDLLFYPPKVDVEGTDDIVKVAYRAADIKVQIKARVSQRATGAFELSIDVEKIPASDPKYILAIHFDLERPQDDIVIWWIPSARFRKLASRSSGQYQALLSPAPNSRDRWVKFRNELREVAAILLSAIAEEDRRQKRRPGGPR
jgi:hypothetical protein